MSRGRFRAVLIVLVMAGGVLVGSSGGAISGAPLLTDVGRVVVTGRYDVVAGAARPGSRPADDQHWLSAAGEQPIRLRFATPAEIPSGAMIRVEGRFGRQDGRVIDVERSTLLASPRERSRICTSLEYGDPFDAMGNGFYGVGYFNAEAMNQLGWIPGQTQSVTTTTSLTLAPLETVGGLKSAIVSALGSYYYLEYRQPIGNYAFLTAYLGSVSSSVK